VAIRANSIVNGGVSTSFALLFYLDQITIETKNVKITGHQWYRSNETEESSVATVKQHVATASKKIKVLHGQPDEVAKYKEILKRWLEICNTHQKKRAPTVVQLEEVAKYKEILKIVFEICKHTNQKKEAQASLAATSGQVLMRFSLSSSGEGSQFNAAPNTVSNLSS